MYANRTNETGQFWSFTLTDTVTSVSTYAGTLFLSDTTDKQGNHYKGYGKLKVGSVSFMEYFLGGDFHSEAGWIGPKFFNSADPSNPNLPTTSVADAEGNSTVNSCIPGYPCGKPHVFYNKGNDLFNNYFLILGAGVPNDPA